MSPTKPTSGTILPPVTRSAESSSSISAPCNPIPQTLGYNASYTYSSPPAKSTKAHPTVERFWVLELDGKPPSKQTKEEIKEKNLAGKWGHNKEKEDCFYRSRFSTVSQVLVFGPGKTWSFQTRKWVQDAGLGGQSHWNCCGELYYVIPEKGMDNEEANENEWEDMQE